MATNEKKQRQERPRDLHPMKDRYFIHHAKDSEYGRVESMVGSDHAMVTFYIIVEGLQLGEQTRLVPVTSMMQWSFYASEDEFHDAARRQIKAEARRAQTPTVQS